MPKPVYIICAENVVQDKDTNLVSIHNVIERFDVTAVGKLPPDVAKAIGPTMKKVAESVEGAPPVGTRPLFKAISVWKKEPGDEEQPLEILMTVTFPDGHKREFGPTPFQFDKGSILQRAIVIVGGQLPVQSGKIRVATSVRKKGDKKWKSQSYDIEVTASAVD
jgi:hypothetical protein